MNIHNPQHDNLKIVLVISNIDISSKMTISPIFTDGKLSEYIYNDFYKLYIIHFTDKKSLKLYFNVVKQIGSIRFNIFVSNNNYQTDKNYIDIIDKFGRFCILLYNKYNDNELNYIKNHYRIEQFNYNINNENVIDTIIDIANNNYNNIFPLNCPIS